MKARASGVRALTPRVAIPDRVLAWLSLRQPGLWRLRADLLVASYATFVVAARLAPLLFAPIAGPRDRSSACDGYRWPIIVSESGEPISEYSYAGNLYSDQAREDALAKSTIPCAGTLPNQYGPSNPVWTTGFNADEQRLIFSLYAAGCGLFALVWAFLVSRGTRLRDVAAKTDAPSFLACVCALAPLACVPFLAGYLAFAVSTDDFFAAITTGRSYIGNAGQFVPVAFPSTGGDYNTEKFIYPLLVIACVLLLAAIMKIIMYDGVIGLIRTGVLALALGTTTVVLTAIAYSTLNVAGGSLSLSLSVSVFVLAAPLFLFWLIYQLDLRSGVRRSYSRPLALVHVVVWPLWFAYVTAMVPIILNLGEFTLPTSGLTLQFSTILYYGAWLVVGILLESKFFEDVGKISLLPRP